MVGMDILLTVRTRGPIRDTTWEKCALLMPESETI